MIICFFGAGNTAKTILERLTGENEITVVLENGTDKILLDSIPDNAEVVVSSEDADVISALSEKQVRVITCGGAKDTLTYTSNSDDGIVISLQRQIISDDGNMCEPFEIPLYKKENDSEYALMAYVAVKAKYGFDE